MNQMNTGFTPESLRLLGAALALQQATCTAANLIPIPNSGRFIAIGTPAEVARLLEIAPAAPASIGVLDTLDAVTGGDIANIEALKAERFYLADDVDGLLRRVARHAAPTEMIELGQEIGADQPLVAAPGAVAAPAKRCPHCDGTGDVHTPTGEWRGRCTCADGVATEHDHSEGGHHD